MNDFETLLTVRDAATYADFVIPHLARDAHVLDCGTGSGSISVGLARHVPNGTITAVDMDASNFAAAREYARTQGIDNLSFAAAYAVNLPLEDSAVDVVFCHSMFELIHAPAEVLNEFIRVLKPGGVLALACVEYSGVIIAGPNHELLRKFYQLKELSWELAEPPAQPRIGATLRGLVNNAGFENVSASAKLISYGEHASVQNFGSDRAAEAEASYFSRPLIEAGYATDKELHAMSSAWREWAQDPGAFMAFPWCRAIGYAPDG